MFGSGMRRKKTGTVKGLGGRSEDSGWVCIQGFGSGSERSNWECLRCHLIEVGTRIDLRGWGLLLFQESAGSISLGLGIWWRGVGGEWVGVLSKGVKGISVSKRKGVRVFWGCILIGVVLVVIEGVLVGVNFKEGMKGKRFRGEPWKIKEKARKELLVAVETEAELEDKGTGESRRETRRVFE